MLLITTFIVMLLSLAVSVLTLSSLGHLHIKADALRQVTTAELFAEVQFQARVTRKALLETIEQKVLPTIGYKGPEPTPLERAFADLEAGRDPVIDLSGLGVRRG